ncbi:MAG: TIGR03086 family metal-binding protein [Acidimicrobiales bacterium]
MSDIQQQYRTVAGGFDAVVRAVAPEQWDAPSPCEEWTARDVVAHVVSGHRGVVAGVTGREPAPQDAAEVPGQAWADALRRMEELTGDPEALAREIDGPTGPMPAGEIIGRFVTMDLLVHTWDLARAVGGDERLDVDAVREAYEALKPADEMIRRPGAFGPKLDPPAGADEQTAFLYFLGRRA